MPSSQWRATCSLNVLQSVAMQRRLLAVRARFFCSEIGNEPLPHSSRLPIKGREREAPGLIGQSDLLTQLQVHVRVKRGLKFDREAGRQGKELPLPPPGNNDIGRKRVG